MGINLLLKSLLYSFHDFPRRYYCPFNIVLLSETNLLLWDAKKHHNWQNKNKDVYIEEPSIYSYLFIIDVHHFLSADTYQTTWSLMR